MPNQELIDFLKASRERIAKPEAWTKHLLASNSNDLSAEERDDLDPDAPDANCWCMVGTVEAQVAALGLSNSLDHYTLASAARNQLHLTLNQLFDGQFECIPDFNDAPKTTHDDVLRVFDLTIQHLETQP